ncbi:hypothetical protein DPMN_173776 [Dreissena polymorpha]|uniref:Uncharacterized protein n=1 Tax=Dreissena polymorpha TaxID=45954 RepID=A0A9D4E433_DREPO|nr:hypothetical protein DPMN_173776 [Dreissena polymorpha]
MSKQKYVKNTDKLILTQQDALELMSKKVREKHRQTDPDTARRKQTQQKNKVRHKHRQTDLDAARRVRADEQKNVREKHRQNRS